MKNEKQQKKMGRAAWSLHDHCETAVMGRYHEGEHSKKEDRRKKPRINHGKNEVMRLATVIQL
jgi:hypothetical protein